jgi:hypothetical protein
MNGQSMRFSRGTYGALARTRVGRAVLVAVALAFVLGALAPACIIAPAMAHDAAPDGVAAEPRHVPAGDPMCCDELRDASVVLGAYAPPAGKRPEWSRPAAGLASAAPHLERMRAPVRFFAGGLPAGFAPIPAYLRTLRLRV